MLFLSFFSDDRSAGQKSLKTTSRTFLATLGPVELAEAVLTHPGWPPGSKGARLEGGREAPRGGLGARSNPRRG